MADPVTWAYIAVVGGSLLSSGYTSKEACYGHRDVMKEDSKISGRCVEVQEPQIYSGTTTGTVIYNASPIHSCYWNGVSQVCN